MERFGAVQPRYVKTSSVAFPSSVIVLPEHISEPAHEGDFVRAKTSDIPRALPIKETTDTTTRKIHKQLGIPMSVSSYGKQETMGVASRVSYDCATRRAGCILAWPSLKC